MGRIERWSPRAAHLALVLLIVSFATQILVNLIPGDPGRKLLGRTATPEQVTALDRQLGVTRPVMVRYWSWLTHAVRGDLGYSNQFNSSVGSLALQRLPVTLELTALAVLMTLAIGVPLGVYSGYKAGRRFDRAATGASSVVIASPQFLTGILLVYGFALTLRWFPVGGWVPMTQNLGENLRSAFMPALTLALTEVVVLSRILRGDVTTTLREPFIEAARARGLSSWTILFRHALRPSSFSAVTLFGLSVATMMGGTVIVESLFSLPGMGQLLYSSVQSKDVVTVQAMVVLIALAYVLINMIIDFLYGLIDPRVRAA